MLKPASLFTLAPTALLVILFLAWPGFPTADPGWATRVAFIFPFVALSPWLVSGSRIATGLTGFLSIAFLAHGVTEIIANPLVKVPAAVEIFLAFTILMGVSTSLRSGFRQHLPNER